MENDFEQCDNKFKELKDGLSKFLYAIWFAKKTGRISDSNCQTLKKYSKQLEKENNFTWRTLLKLKDLDSYLTNLEMFLESVNPESTNKDENIENLSPYSKQAYINSTSPNDDLLYRKRQKKENNLKSQIQKPTNGLIKLN